jgi:Flp pilus assembly protein TadB
MKRVLLLVFLMVSLVELDLERYRIYLFCSTAAVAGLLCNLLMSRRKARNAREAQALENAHGDSLSSKRSSEVACVTRSSRLEEPSQT